MKSERFDFPGADGQNLAARLDLPDGNPLAYALFAHCFTCGKDVLAAGRVAAGLAARGIATVRFDFTGLGASEGEFGNTNFSSNIADLVAAAGAMRARIKAPALLIGHSLGGAAVLAAAHEVPEVKAVATIAAPFEASHVARLFADDLPAIQAQGEAVVRLGGRPFTIRKSFLDDLAEHDQARRIASLHRALLVMHSPTDALVGVDNARLIFEAAHHPKSFVALDGADHLLGRRQDGDYAAGVIVAWAIRYLPTIEAPQPEAGARVEVVETGMGKFQQIVTAGSHHLLADEPIDAGGLGSGFTPYDLLLAGLGACTAMTLRVYADRKGWKLGPVRVALSHNKIHAADCADCETREGKLDEITRDISLPGPLDEEQRERLSEIADMCPVHRTLHSEVVVRTKVS